MATYRFIVYTDFNAMAYTYGCPTVEQSISECTQPYIILMALFSIYFEEVVGLGLLSGTHFPVQCNPINE